MLLAGCAAASGSTWQPVTFEEPANIVTLSSDPLHQNVVFAGSDTGVVYRAASEQTGDPVGGTGIPKTAVVESLLPDIYASHTVFAGTTSGLYVSTDRGATWHQHGSGLPANDSIVALAEGVNDHPLLAGTAQNGLFASNDGGATWVAASSGLPSAAGVNALAYDDKTQTFFVALSGGGVFAGTGNVPQWTDRSSGLPIGHLADALATLTYGAPRGATSAVYAGTAEGVYVSTDLGRNWAQSNGGVPLGKVLSLATFIRSPGAVYAGTQQTLFASQDGGGHWKLLAGGLSRPVTAITVTSSSKVGAVVYAVSGGLMRYPGVGASPGANLAINALILLVMVGAAALLFVRSRRSMARAAYDGPRAPDTSEGEASRGATSALPRTTRGAAHGTYVTRARVGGQAPAPPASDATLDDAPGSNGNTPTSQPPAGAE